mgnify:FL=1
MYIQESTAFSRGGVDRDPATPDTKKSALANFTAKHHTRLHRFAVPGHLYRFFLCADAVTVSDVLRCTIDRFFIAKPLCTDSVQTVFATTLRDLNTLNTDRTT